MVEIGKLYISDFVVFGVVALSNNRFVRTLICNFHDYFSSR